MNVLLVLDDGHNQGVRIIVSISEKKLKNQIIALLEDNKGKEVFELLKSKAQVMEYVPRGKKPKIKTEMTLFEDML